MPLQIKDELVNDKVKLDEIIVKTSISIKFYESLDPSNRGFHIWWIQFILLRIKFITGRFMFMLRVNSNDFHIRHKALQSYETLLFYVTWLYLNYKKEVDVEPLKKVSRKIISLTQSSDAQRFSFWSQFTSIFSGFPSGPRSECEKSH